MKTNTCGECRYYGTASKNSFDNDRHECHLNPPTVVGDGEGHAITHRYPTVENEALACQFFQIGAGYKWPTPGIPDCLKGGE